MIVTSLDEALDHDDLVRRTGWEIKPEGACRGDICVPLPHGAAATPRILHDRLGMPVVGDETTGVWALGPSTASGRALDTAQVPDIELPDVDGKLFKLSSLLGRKVVVVAWASW